MFLGEKQGLSVIGGKGPYTWSIIGGGGSLSTSLGMTTVYTAPMTNPNCVNNPIIRVKDDCGNVASLRIAVTNPFVPGMAMQYVSYALYQPPGTWGWTPQGCNFWWWLGICHYQVGAHSFNCKGERSTWTAYPCSPGHNLLCPGMDIEICEREYADEVSQCDLAWCPKGCAPGFHDTRTTAMKAEGCCPAQLLPPDPSCEVKIDTLRVSPLVLDVSSGQRAVVAGEILAQEDVAWTLTVAGRSFRGKGLSVSYAWDGRDSLGKALEPGVYEALLTAQSQDGACQDAKAVSITVTDQPPSCPLLIDFGSSANVASGNLYHSQRLFFIPNSKLLSDFILSYNSHQGNKVPLGMGWTHSYNVLIKGNNDGSYTLMEGDGSRTVLYPNGEFYTPKTFPYPALLKNPDGSYLLQLKSGLIYLFDPGGKISRLEDRNGNMLLFAYDLSGNLESIADPSGVRIGFSYDSSNRIIGILDPSGNAHHFTYSGDFLVSLSTQTPDYGALNWVFSYDADGFLLSRTDPMGYVTAYGYDEEKRVQEVMDPEGRIRAILYDSAQSISRVREKDGGIWIYTYDPTLGVLREKIDPLGGRTVLEYDSNRNLLSATDPNGNMTRYAYDGYGNVTSVTDPLGNVSSFTYNGLHKVTSITDAKGNVTRFTYDDRGNLTSMTDALGAVTRFAYDPRGNLTQMTDALGRKTTVAYDHRSRPISITDPNGATTAFSYDAVGNLHRRIDALGNETRFSYDSLNLLTRIIDPMGHETQYGYDRLGNRISLKDGNGHFTFYEYNYRGQVTKIKDPLGNQTVLTYGGTGCASCQGGTDRLTSLTDALGNRTIFEYDLAGRLIREIDPLGNFTLYGYDPGGNLTSRTDGNGNRVFYVYDPLGRLVRKAFPDGSSATFAYDPLGNMVQAENAAIGYGMEYDALGRLVRVMDSRGKVLRYEYDALGHRTKMVTPEGKEIRYAYDPMGRLVSLSSSAGGFHYHYDPLGRRIRLFMPNGIWVQYSYDANGRLVRMRQKNAHFFGDRWESSYSYDKVGNRLSKSEGFWEYQYSYDPMDQLIQVLRKAYGDGLYLVWERYGYDPLGNRLDGPHGGEEYSYGSGNRLIRGRDFRYFHDRNGNMIQKVGGRGGGRLRVMTYGYDFENQLTEVRMEEGMGVQAVRFAYDPFGRRIFKGVYWQWSGGEIRVRETQYAYDWEDILMELDHNGGTVAWYVHGPGMDEPLALEKGGRFYYYQVDELGSVRALSDGAGRWVQRCEYDSFGDGDCYSTWFGAPIRQPYRFTGREWDEETGLYYYRARYYDPKIGRFITRDPIRFRSGDVNPYRYVGNNPVNWIDPWGKLAFPYHGFVSLFAGWAEGWGWQSFKLAWDSMAADFGTQTNLASDTNIHGMAGYIPGLGYQEPYEAILAAMQRVADEKACGRHGSAMHTLQDLETPWHAGREWRGNNPLLNWDAIGHWTLDWLPTIFTLKATYDAYKASRRYLQHAR